MSTQNVMFNTSLKAGEDLISGCQYHAIALDDGKLANNGLEASGILQGKPKNKEGLTLGYIGELKFAAGAGISAGSRLSVGTSGWFTSAVSGDYVVGKCKVSVTSGSIGTGFFNFITPTLKVTSWAA